MRDDLYNFFSGDQLADTVV